MKWSEDDLAELFQDCGQVLPQQQREAFELRICRGVSAVDAVKLSGGRLRSAGNVRVLLCRAKKALLTYAERSGAVDRILIRRDFARLVVPMRTETEADDHDEQ